MTENKLAAVAVGIYYKIHTTIGPGLLESVYEAAFAHELNKRNISYLRQQGVVAKYEEAALDVGFRTNIITEDKLIVEIKSIEALDKIHHKIVLNYLSLTGIKLVLLANFNVELIKNGIRRKIAGQLL
jgi:GxxExxY protein